MHTGTHYSLVEFLFWTRRTIYILLFVATVPTFLYVVFDFTWLAIPYVPVALIGTAAAFIAGFKNTQSYNRLWEARKIWGSIANVSRIWGVMARDYVNDNPIITSPDNLPDNVHQRLIYRHIAWLTALRYQLRQPRSWESLKKPYAVEYLNYYSVPEWETPLENEIRPFLSDKDYDYVFAKHNQATQLLSLQSADLRQLREQKMIDTIPYVDMENCIKDFYDYQGKAEGIKDFPYPRQFASINLFFIWLLVVLLPFSMISEFAKIGELSVWLNIPFTVIVGWVFTSLERVGESTENPFEGGPNDVPMTSITKNIEIDLREMLDETELPSLLLPSGNIIM